MKKYFRIKEYFRTLFKYRNRKINDINHSLDRFNERFPQYTFADYKKVIEKGVDIILDIFKDSVNKYLIISKSTDIAVQLEWRKDKKFKDNINHGFTATTLNSRIHKQLLQKDKKIFVEDFKKFNVYKWFEHKENKKMIKEIGYYAINLDKDCEDYKIYLKEGEVHTNFKIIEVN